MTYAATVLSKRSTTINLGVPDHLRQMWFKSYSKVHISDSNRHGNGYKLVASNIIIIDVLAMSHVYHTVITPPSVSPLSSQEDIHSLVSTDESNQNVWNV